MKVQITNSTRVQGVPADPGDVFDVELDLGLRLIAANRAVAIDDTVAVLAAAETPETATLQPDETAVTLKPETEVIAPPETADKKVRKQK